MADSDAVDRLADAVARLRRALRRGARTAVPQEQLPVAQVEVLQLLADQPGTRSGELAGALRLAPTTASTLVGQLLARELVERRPAAGDRRAWSLHLTRRGRSQLRAWQQANTAALRSALERLPAADRRAIERALPALDRLTESLFHDG